MRACFLLLLLVPLTAGAQLVIAHRGASGELPEHTLAAYRRAIEQGADYIEPDLVVTKDGVLVARHENELSTTTDVAARASFAGRRTTKWIDGRAVSGWFAEDFTAAELATLRARERLPELRPASARHDGRYAIPTFEDILRLLAEENAKRKRQAGDHAPAGKEGSEVGVYPELKHPGYFEALGLALEPRVVALLEAHGYRSREAKAILQSFEAQSLRKLARLTELRLVQLLAREPFDLAEIATYAQGIGVAKALLIRRRADGPLGEPTGLVPEAHARGLFVHAWTFRAENAFLPPDFRSAGGRGAHGDLPAEIARYRALGVDGFFTDHPAAAR